MLWLKKLRGWLGEKPKPLADNKLDWPGIILVLIAGAVFSLGVIGFLAETEFAFWLSRREVTPLYLLKKYPSKIFLLTPLAAFYAITRRNRCRTNKGCLQCYAVIVGLIVFSLLAVYWENLTCYAEWGDMSWFWKGAA